MNDYSYLKYFDLEDLDICTLHITSKVYPDQGGSYNLADLAPTRL